MECKLNPETAELFNCKVKLRAILKQIIPADGVDYIMHLITLDNAHKNFVMLTSEDTNSD